MEKAILETVKKGFVVSFHPDFKGTFRLEIHKEGGYAYQTFSYKNLPKPPITWEAILNNLVVKHKKLHGE